MKKGRFLTSEESKRFNGMFNITEQAEQAELFTDEHLGSYDAQKSNNEPMFVDNKVSYTLEITINLPGGEIDVIEKICNLKNVLERFCAEYKAESSYHTIEFCKSGEPHMHATVTLKAPSWIDCLGDTHILRMYSKSIFMLLPKSLYKQWAKAHIDERLRKFSTPALCINLKYYASQGWIDYMNKSITPN